MPLRDRAAGALRLLIWFLSAAHVGAQVARPDLSRLSLEELKNVPVTSVSPKALTLTARDSTLASRISWAEIASSSRRAAVSAP
jgi:hypothetical protein